MKIKSKIYIGIIFLFAEFILITAISTFYLYHLSGQTGLIMKDNNLSVKYAENMLDALCRINDAETAFVFNSPYLEDNSVVKGSLAVFEKNLVNEENNITEIGEKDIIQSVRIGYDKIKNLVSSPLYNTIKKTPDFYFAVFMPAYSDLRTKVLEASAINIQAVERKTQQVKKSVNYEFSIILIVSTICFLITFSFIFNFPHYITRPIVELTGRVRDIADYNYSMRLNYKSDDEIGGLAGVVDGLIAELEKYEQEHLLMKNKGISIDNGVAGLIKTHLQSIKDSMNSIEELNAGRILSLHNELLEKIKSEIERSSELIAGSIKE